VGLSRLLSMFVVVALLGCSSDEVEVSDQPLSVDAAAERFNLVFTRPNPDSSKPAIGITVGSDDTRQIRLKWASFVRNEEGVFSTTVLRSEFELDDDNRVKLNEAGEKVSRVTDLPLEIRPSDQGAVLHLYPGKPNATVMKLSLEGDKGISFNPVAIAPNISIEAGRDGVDFYVYSNNMFVNEQQTTEYIISQVHYFVDDAYAKILLVTDESGVPQLSEKGENKYRSIQVSDVPRLKEEGKLKVFKEQNTVNWKEIQ